MRVTNTLVYNEFLNNYRKSNNALSKLTSQLSSGKKIGNSFDDSSIYVDTMRLTKEQSNLLQIKDVSAQAKSFADNSDQILNQFTKSLDSFKAKLLQANNSTQDQTSINAIANDLEKLREHMMALANTSINGQYLFSGTAMKNKPIDSNGHYQGNDKNLTAVISAGVEESYNITGKELFFGNDNDYNKKIVTNVKLYNQSKLHPDIMQKDSTASSKEVYIQKEDTIRNLVGDNDDDKTNNSNAFFYLYGKKPNGDSFKTKIELSTDKTVGDLLDKIAFSYGNTTENRLVDVKLNKNGQIEIKDQKNGNNQIDFFILGAIDQSGGNGADVTDIDDLTTNPNVKLTEFIKSGFNPVTGIDEKTAYDRNNFQKNKDTLTSNVSQVTKEGDFATVSTKLIQTTGVSTLDNRTFNISLKDINSNSHTVTLDLKNNSSFTVDGTTYDIYNADGTNTKADEFTYRQLTDIISMTIANKLPSSNSKTDYDNAIIEARKLVESNLDSEGKIYIKDKSSQNSNIEFSIYDKDSDDFTKLDAPVLSFNSNNALTIDKPSLDIFKDMQKMIDSVKEGRFEADGNKNNPRLAGIDAAIERLDHISTHIIRKHTKIGSISNSLQNVQDRNTFLNLNITKIRSQIEDADIAETYMKFNQLNINFQAMLSSIAKINSLSLVNYI